MVAQNTTYNYLQFVRFKSLSLWDVKRINLIQLKANYPIIRLGDVIKEENTKYKIFEQPNAEFKILGVNNKIGLFDAYIEKGSKINQPYKKVEKGWLAYNPYRINVGSIGFKHDAITYDYISPAYIVFSCSEKLLPEYLYILFKTERFSKIIRDNTTGSVRQNLSFENLSNFQIPLPSITEQKILVEKHNKLINNSISDDDKSLIFYQQIDSFLFQSLGINPIVEKRKKGINFIRYKELSKWGVEYNIGGIAINKILYSSIYNNDLLKNYVDINPSTNFNDLTITDLSFIPMECISDEYGEISYTQTGTIQKSKGYTRFKNGDLLWAKITPCMENGKSAITSNLLNGYGYGSTEYHVLRAQSEKISIEFIYNLLRTKLVRVKATSTFTGSAGQQRVPKSFLDELLIPIPPLKKQNEINKYISNLKTQIKELHKSSKNNKEKAVFEFEKAIFTE